MNEAQENAAYYAVITAPVRYDPELSSTAKLLYCEITSLCRKKGYCWSTNDYFTRLYNLSSSTISRLISQLERRGHIRIETVAVATGSERRIYTDIYRVEQVEDVSTEGGTQKAQAPSGGCAKTARGGTQKQQGGVRKNSKQNDYQLNDYSEEDPPCSPPEGDKPAKEQKREPSRPMHTPEAFDKFWEKYPKKKSKQAAIKAWDKLKPDRALCREMYAALMRDIRSPDWSESGGKYIPLFSTWLNGRRWEDEGVDLLLLSQPQDGARGQVKDLEVTL